MATLRRAAPIFAVRDLDASMVHYQRMGFATRAYEGGGYGFATRDRVEIHLGVVPDTGPRTSWPTSSSTTQTNSPKSGVLEAWTSTRQRTRSGGCVRAPSLTLTAT